MGSEMQSIRQIAQQLIAEYQAKKKSPPPVTCQEEVEPEEWVPRFEVWDREWLRNLGVLPW